jgi:type II secretory pathway component PulF
MPRPQGSSPMPQYKYQVKKGPGQPATGVLEAENQRAAVARLRDMGFFPISVVEDAGGDGKDVLRDKLLRIKLKDRNIFFRQLANLFEAGMPITRALATLREQTDNPKLAAVIDQIRDDITKGSTFAEALERHPKTFNPMQVNLIRAGESGGMLEEVMWRLVTFGEQEEELRGKAISASIYPCFLLFMGSLAVFILLSFVFPKFLTVFAEFNQELPWPTRVVMAICWFMSRFWWAVLIAIGFIVAGFVSFYRSADGRKQTDAFLLKIPVVGDVIQKFEMAKFARTLGTLLDNGVPILGSIRITFDTLGNKAIAAEADRIHARVSEGESVSESLRQTNYFPPLVVNMFAIGEESGRIGAVARRIADAYDKEVDRAVKAMTALFEPVLIVVMGVIIGFLVIAMLLPMLTISANVA